MNDLLGGLDESKIGKLCMAADDTRGELGAMREDYRKVYSVKKKWAEIHQGGSLCGVKLDILLYLIGAYGRRLSFQKRKEWLGDPLPH